MALYPPLAAPPFFQPLGLEHVLCDNAMHIRHQRYPVLKRFYEQWPQRASSLMGLGGPAGNCRRRS